MDILRKIKEFFPFSKTEKTVGSENEDNSDSSQKLGIEKNEFEELGKLTAAIEHEIRNPLNILHVEIDYMKRKFQHDSEISTFLERIDIQRERILYAANIITMFRLDARDYEEKLRIIELDGFLQRCVKEVKRGMGIPTNNIFFQFNINEIIKILIKAEYLLLQQAIINILKNSVEAIYRTEHKRGEIKVNILKGKSPDFVTIQIMDNGDGIAEENLNRITEVFTTKKAYGRSNIGLGLFITKKIISIHKGILEIESELGKGTTVFICLPRYIPKKHRLEN